MTRRPAGYSTHLGKVGQVRRRVLARDSRQMTVVGDPGGRLEWVIMDAMEYVRAEVVRWTDEEWPGWVEVRISEFDGNVAILVDKAPVFDAADTLVPGVEFPICVEIPCDVLRMEVDENGRRSAVVVLGHGIENQEGRREFWVPERSVTARS